ncbi:MAG: OmpA family protein, partial [Stellaceae bacterium]
RLTSADKNRLAEIAKMVTHNNSRVRIVGYGVAAATGDAAQREFQSFDAALDNAKAVGIELAKMGVPASRIDIETARGANSSDRAEVFVEY